MRLRFIAGGIALLLAGCADTIFENQVTLPLAEVDSQPVPVTLPSGTGTIQVVSGELRGSRFEFGCTWTLNLSDGTSPSGRINDCLIQGAGDQISLTLDLAGPPGPSGAHLYVFGVLTAP